MMVKEMEFLFQSSARSQNIPDAIQGFSGTVGGAFADA